MKTYAVYPEVAGEVAPGSNGSFTYKITEWSGSDIIKIKDYLVTEPLANALAASGLTGFVLNLASVRNLTRINLPKWFRIQIVAGFDGPDIYIDGERRLVISGGFRAVLLEHNMAGVEILPIAEAPSLDERNLSILLEMKRLAGGDK